MRLFFRPAKKSARPAAPRPALPINREIVGILLVTLAVLIFLSLWSFSLHDVGWSGFPESDTVVERGSPQNLVGLVGAYIAKVLIWLVGSAALAIPFVILVYGIRMFLTERKSVTTILGSVLLILGLSTLVWLHHPVPAQVLEDGITSGVYAGHAGAWTAGKLEPLFGRWGTTILLGALLLVSLLLITPFSLSAGVGSIPTGVGKMGQWVRFPAWQWPAWWKDRSQPKANKPLKINRESRKQRPIFAFLKEDDPKEEPPLEQDAQAPAEIDFPARSGLRTVSRSDVGRPEPVRKVAKGYHLPDPVALLEAPPVSNTQQTDENLESQSQILTGTLQNFGIAGKVTEVHPGPVITMYEFAPGPGIKVARIVTLAHDLAMALKAPSVRIVVPLPGKSTVGIEVPNPVRETVALREILTNETYANSRSKLTLALGKDIFGRPCVADLKTMPHLLVAGATGAGKSVGLNSMLLSLLFSAHPDEVKLLLIDPKVLELQVYDGIPHLLHPVLTSPKAAARGLTWVLQEMERRYRLLAEYGVRNIQAYNQAVGDDLRVVPRPEDGLRVAPRNTPQSNRLGSGTEPEETGDHEPDEVPQPLPYIVVVVDEFADLMMTAPKEVEEKIARLAQMARASGIHLILATQRPSVDVVTGLIKANFPTRIAYQVSSKTDSRTILDTNGAESLLGWGDMLYLPPGTGRLTRLHGSYVSDDEVRRVVEYVKAQAGPEFCNESAFQEQVIVEENQERDEIYEQAREVVLTSGQASASLIQRRLRLGYPRAARMIEQMEEEGLVSAPGRDGRREVLGRRMALEEEVG
ncbi:MAG: DNA translocase FtsK 4TM domain-containing protein [Nitrospira sp.]|nr:DNA translocase FtsK 4TM domain-containing protein [Nitrospira sp.]